MFQMLFMYLPNDVIPPIFVMLLVVILWDLIVTTSIWSLQCSFVHLDNLIYTICVVKSLFSHFISMDMVD